MNLISKLKNSNNIASLLMSYEKTKEVEKIKEKEGTKILKHNVGLKEFKKNQSSH